LEDSRAPILGSWTCVIGPHIQAVKGGRLLDNIAACVWSCLQGCDTRLMSETVVTALSDQQFWETCEWVALFKGRTET
jgi:hypothetical protein